MPKISNAPARPGRPRDEAVHRAILKAGSQLLGEQGYGAFSIEGVAARAGVAKQSIYRRWPSKGALLLDLYMDGMSDDSAADPSLDPAEQLRHLLSRSIERLREPAWANTLRSIIAEAQTD